MKAVTKRIIVGSCVVASGLFVFWLTGTPWVRGANAAFCAMETVIFLGASMALPIYKDSP